MHRFINTPIKRIIAFLFILTVMFPLSGCSQSYVSDSKQVMDKLNIDASVSDNGDMTVTETWRVNLQNRDKVYRNLYKSFLNQQNIKISNLSVNDLDYGTNYKLVQNINPAKPSDNLTNVCYIFKTDKETEIGWYMPPIESGIRNFKIQYTIKNITQVYKDTAVLWFGFIGKNFSLPITELKGSITLPNGEKLSHAWLHCTAESNLKIQQNNKISITAKEIPANTFVETRILAPTSLFPNSKNISNSEVKNNIINEEKKWAEDWAKKQQTDYIVGIIDAAAGALLAVIGLVVLLRIKKKNRPYKVDAPEYTRDIPDGSSPAGVASLFYYYHGGVTAKVQGRVFSSTLMSLARKGYIQFSVNESKDFVLKITDNSRTFPLTKSENNFYEMVLKVASSYKNQFTMKQFEDYAKQHSKYIDSNMQKFLLYAKQEIADKGYFEHRPDFLTLSSVLGTVSIIAAICIFIFTQAWLFYIPIGALILGLLLVSAGKVKTRLSKIGEYDYAVWHGLKKYMLEFSRMKEYGVPELALWEEYLVYATMMGISKKVCEQLKLVYPQLNDTNYLDTNFSGTYMYYLLGNHMRISGVSNFGNDFASYIGTTMTNISTSATRLAHPPTSNNSSGGFGGGGFGGGGFGGGGGGFGSGGGGGVR